MSSYQNLDVWQKAVELCVQVYKETEEFPQSEKYGITSQIRRAVVSIPSNIAEGQRRGHLPEYLQFLRIAYGSGSELETQLLIAIKLNYLSEKTYQNLNNLLQAIMRMLNRLIFALQKKV